MKPFLIVAFAIVIVAVVVIMFFKSKRDKVTSDVVDENNGLTIEGELTKQGSYEMTVQFDNLKSLEHECAQLLGQANLSLQEITGKKNLDYAEYEKLIGEAETWYQYQQILLEVMYKISDLSYALNLGAISRENSLALCLPYAKQSEGALEKLMDWHQDNGAKLEINVDKSRRKRQGVEGFFMSALGVFNNDFNYRKVSVRTISLIEHQVEGKVLTVPTAEDDFFQEDVRLVAKEGKLYYLPNAET